MQLYAIDDTLEGEEYCQEQRKGATMNHQTELHRPAVMDTLTETQLKELEFQASEYDREDFYRVAANYGWTEETTADAWRWFEVLHTYPLDGTGKDT